MDDECPDRRIDSSDELQDTRYAERLICDKEVLIHLSRREIVKIPTLPYCYVITDRYELRILYKEDLMDRKRNYLGKYIQSPANKVNSVFVALEIPYLAEIWKSHEAVKYKRPYDSLKIHKYDDRFDPMRYNCKAAAQKNKKGKYKRPYEEPTTGARERVNRWMSEIGIKDIGKDIIDKLNYKFKS